MMGPLINTGLVITLFAIAAPFIFVLLVIRMFTGSERRDHRHKRKYDKTNSDMEEIAKGLKDLNKRIDNLETIRKHKRDKE